MNYMIASLNSIQDDLAAYFGKDGNQYVISMRNPKTEENYTRVFENQMDAAGAFTKLSQDVCLGQYSFQQRVEQVKNYGIDQVTLFREKTAQMYSLPGELTPEDVESQVRQYAQEIIDANHLDVEITDVLLGGSRCRGLGDEESDIDIILGYKGYFKEDALFNILNEGVYQIDGLYVDINPISPIYTGSLESYLPDVERYLAEKANEEEIERD